MSPVRRSRSWFTTFPTAAVAPSKYLGALILTLGDCDWLKIWQWGVLYSLHLTLSAPVSPPPVSSYTKCLQLMIVALCRSTSSININRVQISSPSLAAPIANGLITSPFSKDIHLCVWFYFFFWMFCRFPSSTLCCSIDSDVVASMFLPSFTTSQWQEHECADSERARTCT